ncbi:MAG: TetR family transcriptional regulator [Flavobacteriaceae bacterium]|nr:TetR family transcriptional regulator [Flavobacteriaceae bacterium]
MKDTKEIIINTALKLFNTEGLSKVTLRTIANKMGISQGNLNYHFKKRDDIIEALYFDLVGSISGKMASGQNENIDLKSLLSTSTMIMESFYDYRFFMLDFSQVMRENSKIKKHHAELMVVREKQFINMIDILISDNIIRKQVLPSEYIFLYKRLQIISDFWISSMLINTSTLNKSMISEYSQNINQSIYPYLTSKGEEEYRELTD